ncbi:MAG: HEAT repeat domain-containing protein [Cyanobacteria bacterium P01_C01_bin.89]
MDKRFANIFSLTEDEAIALLDTPPDQLEPGESRYIAASHLINFPTERAIAALVRAVEFEDGSLDTRIVQRKAVESLGRLRATSALGVIRKCLSNDDLYTVENAVWAIGEIGTEDPEILEGIAQLLPQPNKPYRVIIQTLSKLDYGKSVERIRPFMTDEDEPTASAAIATVSRFSGDDELMAGVVEFLQHSSVNARRLSIQDLVDAGYAPAIVPISQCPVSVVFRLRGIRLLATQAMAAGTLTFATLEPILDATVRDSPTTLNLVHEYDQLPALEFAMQELYQTDFGRCYLATQTLAESFGEEVGPAAIASFRNKGHNDYGAHYHLIKVLGWIRHAPAYELFVEALHNPEPQFQKSRAAAAIALGELGDRQAIAELETVLDSPIWDLKYATLLALKQLGATDTLAKAAAGDDPLLQGKVAAIAPSQEAPV